MTEPHTYTHQHTHPDTHCISVTHAHTHTHTHTHTHIQRPTASPSHTHTHTPAHTHSHTHPALHTGCISFRDQHAVPVLGLRYGRHHLRAAGGRCGAGRPRLPSQPHGSLERGGRVGVLVGGVGVGGVSVVVEGLGAGRGRE